MSILNNIIGGYPLGVWIAIIALCLMMLGWVMQIISVINWDLAVDLKIQEERFSGDDTERAIAHFERSMARADLIWPLPLCVIAIIGIFQMEFYGFVAGMMEFAIGIYWPLAIAFEKKYRHPAAGIIPIFMILVPCVLGVIGLWANYEYFL